MEEELIQDELREEIRPIQRDLVAGWKSKFEKAIKDTASHYQQEGNEKSILTESDLKTYLFHFYLSQGSTGQYKEAIHSEITHYRGQNSEDGTVKKRRNMRDLWIACDGLIELNEARWNDGVHRSNTLSKGFIHKNGPALFIELKHSRQNAQRKQVNFGDIKNLYTYHYNIHGWYKECVIVYSTANKNAKSLCMQLCNYLNKPNSHARAISFPKEQITLYAFDTEKLFRVAYENDGFYLNELK